jgi:hypothetical protein
MMGKITIACYRPKEGKAAALKELMKEHLPILISENLVTERKSIMMEAKDGTIVEVFEWISDKAIEQAHTNKAVLAMWERFALVCDYVIPTTIDEFTHLFSGFEPIN